jgi:hypothetical protein
LPLSELKTETPRISGAFRRSGALAPREAAAAVEKHSPSGKQTTNTDPERQGKAA